jgi:uncharacterized protein (TIGR00255 family)
MTAFARESGIGNDGELTWEIRSVNHRYLEAFVRLPEDLKALDPAVRERIGKRVARGKLDCSLRYASTPGSTAALQVNERYLNQLLDLGDKVAQLVGRSASPAPFELLRWPGVVLEEKSDLGPVMARALSLLDAALASLVAVRTAEGERLAELISARCEKLAACVTQARERMPVVAAEMRARLLERLEAVRAELDPNRLEQELALIAQRMDVDEEMDRMQSHVNQVRTVLQADGPVGRRLDFLMQELNREANTLASKSSDLHLTRVAMEMKILIEQMREQVQNIE